jgi:hypothetical protein
MRSGSLQRAFELARRNIGFVCTAVALIYLVIHAFDPPRLNWGDSDTDYTVMTTGRNFEKYGFTKLRLTPYLLDPAYWRAPTSTLVYTHYPQLPDLVNGVERAALRMSSLTQFRLVALAFSFAALFFVYSLVATYWSRVAAQCSIALIVLNPLWIQQADYLHNTPYGFFFGSGSVWLLSRYFGESVARRRTLVGAGVMLFLAFLSSYDIWFLVPILLAIVTVGHERGVTARGAKTLAFLAAFALAAILFKWGTNAWALGSFQAWLADLRYQATERSTTNAVKADYVGGLWSISLGRIEQYFSLLFFLVTLIWAALAVRPQLRTKLRWRFATNANPLVILGASLLFFVAFSEIWVEQPYHIVWMVPYYAVATGVLAALLLESGSGMVASLGAVLVLAPAWSSVDENLSFKKAFFDQRAIASLKSELDSVSMPGQNILVNHVFDGAYRYYFNRFTTAMIAVPPSRMSTAIAHYSDSSQGPTATERGAIFVQHKHVADELFDKGYYFVVAPYRLWPLWANPRRYETLVDSLVADRDARLERVIAARGRKLAETEFYTLWQLPPTGAGTR